MLDTGRRWARRRRSSAPRTALEAASSTVPAPSDAGRARDHRPATSGELVPTSRRPPAKLTTASTALRPGRRQRRAAARCAKPARRSARPADAAAQRRPDRRRRRRPSRRHDRRPRVGSVLELRGRPASRVVLHRRRCDAGAATTTLVEQAGGRLQVDRRRPEDRPTCSAATRTPLMDQQFRSTYDSALAGRRRSPTSTLDRRRRRPRRRRIVPGARRTSAASAAPAGRRRPSGSRASCQQRLGLASLGVLLVLLAVAVGGLRHRSLLFVTDDDLVERRCSPTPTATAPTDDRRRGRRRRWPRPRSCSGPSRSPSDFAERQGFLTRSRRRSSGPTCRCGPAEALFFYVAVVVVAASSWPACSPATSSRPRRRRPRRAAPAGRRQLPGQAPAQDSSWPSCPTCSSCCPARSGPATRSCRASRRCPRRSTSPMGKELRRVVTEARLGRAARGGARGVGRAHGQRRLRLGRHGHPHPAGGRRQPGRAAA